jgi:5-oxoprolinase (ATP-hydrolysing)
MSSSSTPSDLKQWQFWIDRGGTFTDIVALSPEQQFFTKKLLSENPEAYEDAALHGIREFLQLEPQASIPANLVSAIKMGTTVATNALLERKGEPTILVINQGLGEILEIGHQARPKTFALNIKKPDLLYETILEVPERLSANGEVIVPLDEDLAKKLLQASYDEGYRSVAIVLIHGHMYNESEKKLAGIAKLIGFEQISCSHEVSPLTKVISRGETTVVDAYLTPILQRYISRITDAMEEDAQPGKLLFMQSSGGLTDARKFRGRDAILSGPAGGIVGSTRTAALAGFNKVIGFDMGGTSTDVSHYAGKYEKTYETEVAGVNMRVPMMYIHTVAAGGGSLLKYDGDRFRVGPESAGADPGPVCYRRGGQLAVTDINICLGKIQPDFFPRIFGPNQDQALDYDSVIQSFSEVAKELADGRSPQDIAEGFLKIAIEHMSSAIKRISVERGYDIKEYVLNCFGGAGGQHACLVAEKLGMKTIFFHPFSGVLSAYGMGLADLSTEHQQVLDIPVNETSFCELEQQLQEFCQRNEKDLQEQGLDKSQIKHELWARLRYDSTDTAIKVEFEEPMAMSETFEIIHQQQYGFIAKEKAILIETLGVTSYGGAGEITETKTTVKCSHTAQAEKVVNVYVDGDWRDAPVYNISKLEFGHEISGPAIISEPTGTIVIEPGWHATITDYGHIVVNQTSALHATNSGLSTKMDSNYDPVNLEIFNNLFMSIAKQMGIVLQNTSQSVNIKERLDFSCAIFDDQGNLVANAPHVPVHLGSMDQSVKVVAKAHPNMQPGDVYVQNNPYNGGSHLPDITVVTPVFYAGATKPSFYVASRAHHEDIGGIAPGSMSPLGKTIHEEGIVLDNVKLVDKGQFLTHDITQKLSAGQYPARNVKQNIADLVAQIAANNTGANELKKLMDYYSGATVKAYMGYIQLSANLAVKRVIAKLTDSQFSLTLDSGASIAVAIRVNDSRDEVTIDFTGTSEQQPTNFNAPKAITQAAVLYVFRCLVDDEVPLNAGCMQPITIIVPAGSMLNPIYPAAVVAGNVETSQAVTNALFGALGALGSSQGTMNNLTFGNEKYQYYETICSGSPAGFGFDGTDAVHTHMTNTRLTDPEILEQRYPVRLEEFSIRRGSGGKGQWCAGDGITRRIKFLETMDCSILSDFRVQRPFGLDGGELGEAGRNWVERSNGTIEKLDGCAQTVMHPNDVIGIDTPTGGGVGPLSKREQK